MHGPLNVKSGAFIGTRENFRLRHTFNNTFSVSYMFSINMSRVCETMHSGEATVNRVRRCTGSPSNALLSISAELSLSCSH